MEIRKWADWRDNESSQVVWDALMACREEEAVVIKEWQGLDIKTIRRKQHNLRKCLERRCREEGKSRKLRMNRDSECTIWIRWTW